MRRRPEGHASDWTAKQQKLLDGQIVGVAPGMANKCVLVTLLRNALPHTPTFCSRLLTGGSEHFRLSNDPPDRLIAQRPSGNGGAYRDRTDDPLLAKQVLSQLS